MTIVLVPTKAKRPPDMTHERVLHLFETGLTTIELAVLCHVSRARIYAMLKQARRYRATKQVPAK